MMRNLNVVMLIVFFNVHRSIQVFQEIKYGTNNTAHEQYKVDIDFSKPYKNLDSFNLRVNKSFTFHRRHFNLFPFKEKNVFLATYHNVVDSILTLITYWRMENVAFIIDSDAGIGPIDFRDYLNVHLINVLFKVIFMDSTPQFVEKMKKALEESSNFAVICNQHNTNEILKVIQSKHTFSTSRRWIFFSQTFPKLLQNTIISVESQVTLIFPKADTEMSVDIRNSPELVIYDVFYSYQTRKIEAIKFAYWTVLKGLFMLENLESNDSILRLRGRTIKLGAFIHLPYVAITETNKSVHFSGYKVELIEMLMEYFNANYSINKYPQSWGFFINGTYTGLLGVAYRKEIDVPINGFMQADFRMRASRFLYPLTKLDLAIGYTTPTPVIPPTTHLFPFRSEVWLCIAIGLICVLLALAIAMHFSPGWKLGQLPSLTSHTDIFRLITGTFFEEVLTYPPGITAKVLYGTLLMATLAVFVFYTSVFTSFLAYRELKMPIRNLNDLAESPEYSPVTIRNSVYEGMFRFAKDGVFKLIWKKMEKSETESLPHGVAKSVETMYRGKNAMVTDSASIIAGMNNNCSISVIKTRLLREYLWMVTRNDFPYSRMIYMRLLHISEGGLFERFGKKYMSQSRPPCDKPIPSLTLGILQVVGLFFMLSCGMLLALLTLLIEKALEINRTIEN